MPDPFDRGASISRVGPSIRRPARAAFARVAPPLRGRRDLLPSPACASLQVGCVMFRDADAAANARIAAANKMLYVSSAGTLPAGPQAGTTPTATWHAQAYFSCVQPAQPTAAATTAMAAKMSAAAEGMRATTDGHGGATPGEQPAPFAAAVQPRRRSVRAPPDSASAGGRRLRAPQLFISGFSPNTPVAALSAFGRFLNAAAVLFWACSFLVTGQRTFAARALGVIFARPARRPRSECAGGPPSASPLSRRSAVAPRERRPRTPSSGSWRLDQLAAARRAAPPAAASPRPGLAARRRAGGRGGVGGRAAAATRRRVDAGKSRGPSCPAEAPVEARGGGELVGAPAAREPEAAVSDVGRPGEREVGGSAASSGAAAARSPCARWRRAGDRALDGLCSMAAATVAAAWRRLGRRRRGAAATAATLSAASRCGRTWCARCRHWHDWRRAAPSPPRLGRHRRRR